MISSYWHKIQIFDEGDDYFSSLLLDINKASEQILVESYIFEYDPLTIEVLEQLKAASNRGCQIRILVDGVGSLNSITKLQNYCKKNHLRFRVYHPVPKWSEIFKFFNFLILKRLNIFKPFNRRNHRKCIIVDNKICYLGSLNLTAIHSKKHSPTNYWKDTGVRLEGGSIDHLIGEFKRSWILGPRGIFLRPLLKMIKREQLKNNYHPKDSLFRLNTTTKNRWLLYRDLLKRIKQSRSEIKIETAYFLPKRSLLKALIKAAERGVNVSIIIPGKSDVPAVKWASYEILLKLIQKNIKVLEYQERVLHSKFIIIDQWASIGSMNLNHRSIFHDLEVEASFNDKETLSELKNIWDKDSRKSKLITESHFKDRNALARLASRIAFKLRYFL